MPRFMAFSAGPSSGQAFIRRGQVGNTYASAAADLDAMSNRFMFLGRDAAESAADIMEEEVVKYVDPEQSSGFKYSEGRLAATIGTWKPEKIKDADVLQQAEVWAVNNGLSNIRVEFAETHEVIENGAYRSIKRVRAGTYASEIGTFTPYAGLVEDGGDMPIHPYNNPDIVVNAHWEPHNMFAKGLFDAQEIVGDMIMGRVKSIVYG